MKALIITGERRIEIAEKPLPELKAGEILVKINYTGFCGSDLNTFLGRNPMVKLPVIPGHEISGEIAEVADGVPEQFRKGQLCTINPYTNCGHCTSCRNSRPNACRYNQTLGVQRDGAMCEYIAVPWQKVLTINDMPKEYIALVEPMSVGFHAVSRAQITDTDTVMVLGCGMIGIGAIVRAALRGATVIAVDMDDAKLTLARQLGASFTVNSKTEDLHQRIETITDGAGPDVVVEAVGTSETYRTAVNEVAFTGRIVCIGYAKSEIPLETKYFVQKELDIRGSRNALPEDFRAVINYLKRNTEIASRTRNDVVHGSSDCFVPRNDVVHGSSDCFAPRKDGTTENNRKQSIINNLISGIYTPDTALEALEAWAAAPAKIFRILIKF
ncbi:MAG: zinc-binding alcohol dehydrogenase family protein [Tannerella sp.]|jgi:threonine dehydrogenase-like Zn-dependent dehydrogenase|nr:zinc-binding alcohol dehydrogenase family protein [Tannerella sp.]